MKCEICNAIERLGLDPSAHELWFCADSQKVARKVSLLDKLAHFTVSAASLHRIAADHLMEHLGSAVGAGIHHLPAYREHYIKLGL
jgi:hypothetical protein